MGDVAVGSIDMKMEDSKVWVSQQENEDYKPVATHHTCRCQCGCVVDGVSNEKSDEQYLASFPAGWRFAPSEQQLIYYLDRKVKNQTLPPNKIKSVNLYEFDPLELLANYKISVEDNEWYFFTPRERKYKHGSRPSRSAGKGYWKATGVDKEIFEKGKKVGSKKTLVYYVGKAPKGMKTNFIMHEFVLHEGSTNNSETTKKNTTNHMRLNEWVLCRIHKKVDKNSLKKNDNKMTSNEADSTEEMDDKKQLVPIETSGSNLSTTFEPTTEANEEESGLQSSTNVDESALPGSNVFNAHPLSYCSFPSQGHYLAPQCNNSLFDPSLFMGNQDFQHQDEVKLSKDLMFLESNLFHQPVPLDFYDFDEQKNCDLSQLVVTCIPNYMLANNTLPLSDNMYYNQMHVPHDQHMY